MSWKFYEEDVFMTSKDQNNKQSMTLAKKKLEIVFDIDITYYIRNCKLGWIKVFCHNFDS